MGKFIFISSDYLHGRILHGAYDLFGWIPHHAYVHGDGGDHVHMLHCAHDDDQYDRMSPCGHDDYDHDYILHGDDVVHILFYLSLSTLNFFHGNNLQSAGGLSSFHLLLFPLNL